MNDFNVQLFEIGILRLHLLVSSLRPAHPNNLPSPSSSLSSLKLKLDMICDRYPHFYLALAIQMLSSAKNAQILRFGFIEGDCGNLRTTTAYDQSLHPPSLLSASLLILTMLPPEEDKS